MSNAMKLCVSLDLSTAEENLALVKEIKGFDVWLKVGFRTYIRDGKAFLEELKAINPNFKIFLDLKLYDIPNKPLVLAVTALTSFDNDSFKAIYNEDINTKATQFAIDTYNSGVDGVVCSAYESLDIKNNTSTEFITLCPGIRPFGEDSGDQKRVADIPFAKENLVDFIVVGRPIYKSTNPKNVVEEILKNI